MSHFPDAGIVFRRSGKEHYAKQPADYFIRNRDLSKCHRPYAVPIDKRLSVQTATAEKSACSESIDLLTAAFFTGSGGGCDRNESDHSRRIDHG